MMVHAKITKTYNYLIRILIIAATYFFLYRQVFQKRNLDEVYEVFRDFFTSSLFQQGIALILVLMLINWGLEAVKWKILIRRIEKVSWVKSFEAVLTGVSVTIFMPNRTGDYLGRVFILEKANRIEGVLITIIGSISQLIITLSLGMFGFLAYYYEYLNKQTVLQDYIGAGLILLVPVLVFLLILVYFNLKSLTPILSKLFRGRFAKYAHYVDVFSAYSTVELFKVLLLSFLRYAVFSTQFYLLLLLFNVRIPYPDAIILISMIYLFMMVVPSIALTEIGIRGSLSIYIISKYFTHIGVSADPYELGIFAASSLLWFINIVMPAIAGTFFVFKLKFFRK